MVGLYRLPIPLSLSFPSISVLFASFVTILYFYFRNRQQRRHILLYENHIVFCKQGGSEYTFKFSLSTANLGMSSIIKVITRFYITFYFSFLFYCALFHSILFNSILFYYILLYSIIFYSILFHSIPFYYILSIIFNSILFYSILFY
jgi:hypothetical protein